MAAMCIANPLAKKSVSFFEKLSGLWATHPPIQERIKVLQIMDGQRTVI
jgi:heat shock protein HtpX